MQKSRFLQNSGLLQFARRNLARHGELGIRALWSSSPLSSPWRKISPWRREFGQAKLTAQHVLSIRFATNKGYPRLGLAVSF